ncbi:MAG: polyphosphate kinase 2 family protein, partial [Verrucomicrobia bacterium]|nr:polyphosphate kinase 2 family protein [Verrucomicrobiota bacterium]
HVIPADEKHVAHALVAEIVVKAIQNLGLRTPTLPKKERAALRAARKQLAKV